MSKRGDNGGRPPSPAAGATPARHGADYGFDAPVVPAVLGAAGAALAVVGLVLLLRGPSPASSIGPLVAAVFFLLSAGVYVHTTRRGKFAVWEDLLREAHLRGDEHLLDMGCGRGSVLIMAAKLLPAGHAVGLDLWRSADQSGNSPEAALANAVTEGVRDRVELVTGDMRRMPFADHSFDLVVSSAAIHNIRPPSDRDDAIGEAVRVLRPGGRLIIADINATASYVRRLRELGMEDVRHRRLGWRFWYGGPWVAASAVTASEPDGQRTYGVN